MTARCGAHSLAVAAAASLLWGCESEPPQLRLPTESFTVQVVSDPQPPYAVERVTWRITVRDRETRQPVEGGEGRLYATNLQQVTVWNGLEAGPELGTYIATVLFPTSGQWGMAVEFRRDSTQVLEKVEWSQEVLRERAVPDVMPPPDSQ